MCEGCTTGFVYVDGACFKFGRQLLSWEEARADCRLTPGADLAIIDNESELNMVLNLTGGSDWWIGESLLNVKTLSVWA